MDAAKTPADFVNERRGEGVGLAYGRVARGRNLVALVEPATVGNAPERPGLELWVVEVADAREELVLLAEVVIHPHVKLIDFFPSHRAGRVVNRQHGGGGWKRIDVEKLDGVRVQTANGNQISDELFAGKADLRSVRNWQVRYRIYWAGRRYTRDRICEADPTSDRACSCRVEYGSQGETAPQDVRPLSPGLPGNQVRKIGGRGA